MRNGVVVLALHRTVATLDVLVYVWAHRIIFSRGGGALDHALIGCLHVKVAESLHPGVHNDGYGWVAFHFHGFSSVEFPFG